MSVKELPIDIKILTPVQFGLGDRVSTVFDLVGPDGETPDSIVSANIYRDDWQGHTLLYDTPRTNYTPWSMDATKWNAVGVTAVDSQTIAAAGTNGYCDAGPGPIGITPGTRVGVLYQFGVGTIQYTTLTCSDFVVGQFNVTVDLFNGIVTHQGFSGTWSDPNYSIRPDGEGGWFVFMSAVQTGAGTAAHTYPNIGGGVPVGETIIVKRVMCILGYDVETGFIETAGSAVTVTDYTRSGSQVTTGVPPAEGIPLSWDGEFIYTPTVPVPTLPETTIISQYGTSPTLRQLITNMAGYLDPSADLDAFYSNVWDIETAVGFGLDIWGKIVGVNRSLEVPASDLYFGFSEGGGQPFGQAPFYLDAQTNTYLLSDDAYRTLILVKALANISDCTAPSYNQLLQNLFAGRGRCYVSDLGNMQLQYTFEFALEPYELSILTESGALPRPSGVQAQVLEVDLSATFGFQEAVNYEPFGYGTFGQEAVIAN